MYVLLKFTLWVQVDSGGITNAPGLSNKQSHESVEQEYHTIADCYRANYLEEFMEGWADTIVKHL